MAHCRTPLSRAVWKKNNSPEVKPPIWSKSSWSTSTGQILRKGMRPNLYTSATRWRLPYCCASTKSTEMVGELSSEGSLSDDLDAAELTELTNKIFYTLLNFLTHDYMPTYFMPAFCRPVWKFEKYVLIVLQSFWTHTKISIVFPRAIFYTGVCWKSLRGSVTFSSMLESDEPYNNTKEDPETFDGQ